jgi:uncharacterized iron-regulated membrane protein
MNPWQQWVQRPQNLWIRRALFQVHLWVGIGIGFYVVLISVSGSAIVYRPQLMKIFDRQEKSVTVSGVKLSDQKLTQRIKQAYPEYDVAEIATSRRPDRPTTVLLQRGNKRISRLFNPYTGEDLGDSLSPFESAVDWLVDFHDNLLSGRTGRFWNGVGAIVVTLTSLTGLVLWWPGIKNWRRSTIIKWKAHFPLFNWTLHNAIGFWCSVLVLMWGLSGIYFIFPDPFNALFGSSQFLFWLARFHFGRFGRIGRATWFDWSLSLLWVVLGLVPALLAVTGFLMWWNRVLRKRVLPRQN